MKFYLGIDPGLSEVGFGIIKSDGRKAEFVDCGIIKTTPKNSFSERLEIIKKDLSEILSMYKYEAVGIEDLYFAKNVTNGLKVAHARGVILLTIHESKIPIYEFSPLEVKNNICGYGGADKLQVQEMVKRLLELNTLPKPHDAADALAIAMCTERSSKF
ncbi:crossover junction endodeoxyribonuclease RuvC [Candidatus Peregrinibacteria bacterium]|nr:crossover junction endodeoxyribonuclease RuvC [Candidatus Peregrinibacteria bacterium]